MAVIYLMRNILSRNVELGTNGVWVSPTTEANADT